MKVARGLVFIRIFIFVALAAVTLFYNESLKAQEMFFHLLGLGPRYNITGITSTNTSDADLDANLNRDTRPVVHWQALAGAISYNVTIYQDDKTTVACATQNTATNLYDFSACSLTLGTFYRVHVMSVSTPDAFPADNNYYRFYVNNAPTMTSQGPWYMMVSSGACFDINALYSAPPGVGVASDVDSGQTLSFTAVAASQLGNTIVNNSSYIRYTNNFKRGTDTFAVTISDSNGGRVTGDLVVYSMDEYTWTGGAGTNVYETGGNWCGSINANKTGCAGATAKPTSAYQVYIDSRCATAFCDPVASVNPTEVYSLTIAANSLTLGNGVGLNIVNGTYNQSGGTFNGGNSNIVTTPTVSSSFTISGGTFNSTSGTLVLGRATGYNLSVHYAMFISGTGVFNHNNGTVNLAIVPNPDYKSYGCENVAGTLYCYSDTYFISTGEVQFYNLNFYQTSACIANSYNNVRPKLATGGGSFTDGGKIVVNNTFNHGDGTATCGAIQLLDNFEIKGNYNINVEAVNNPYGSQYVNGVNMAFTGTAAQTVTVSSTGQASGGIYTVNKAAGSVVLGSNLTIPKYLNSVPAVLNGDLTITTGLFDMNGFNLTVDGTLTNNDTLKRGNSPTCGTVTSGTYAGTAAICP